MEQVGLVLAVEFDLALLARGAVAGRGLGHFGAGPLVAEHTVEGFDN
jgi:hypothetical protein